MSGFASLFLDGSAGWMKTDTKGHLFLSSGENAQGADGLEGAVCVTIDSYRLLVSKRVRD